MAKIFYSSFDSPVLKRVFVASTSKGVCAVDFLISERSFLKSLRQQFSGDVFRDDRKNRAILSQLKRYLTGGLKRFDCRLDVRGTLFEKRVWSALRKIPYGETRSYREIARAIGHPKAWRAVGNANRRNPIPLIIPCHRVIESNGGLGGYGHGVEVKKRLLHLEQAHGIR